MDLLRDTWSSLRAHKLRFLLTSLGITWGAFLLTFLSGSLTGLNNHYERQIEAAGPKLVVMWPGTEITHRLGERGARAIAIDNDDLPRIDGVHTVEQVSPNLTVWSQIVRADGRTKLFTVNGIGPEAREVRSLTPQKGRFISPTDIERTERVAYLGAVAAERLFGQTSPIGRTLQIESLRFRVIGVNVEKGEQMVSIGGWDDWSVFVPYTTAQRWLLKHERIEQLAVAPLTREGSHGTIRSIRQVLGLHHDFPPDLAAALHFYNIHDTLQLLWGIMTGFRVFLTSAGLITLFVGAVGVMNIMLVVVGERTDEIGLRKAIGATDRSIFRQFLAEAVAVCGLSGVAGAGMGVAISQLLARLMPAGGPLGAPPEISVANAVGITLALILVGLFAGVVPAVRASRIPPAEALRASECAVAQPPSAPRGRCVSGPLGSVPSTSVNPYASASVRAGMACPE